jgi:hypothetical protein
VPGRALGTGREGRRDRRRRVAASVVAAVVGYEGQAEGAGAARGFAELVLSRELGSRTARLPDFAPGARQREQPYRTPPVRLLPEDRVLQSAQHPVVMHYDNFLDGAPMTVAYCLEQRTEGPGQGR